MIYTDPPYTDQCPYLEKSQYFRDWLSTFYSPLYNLTEQMLNDEIVVSNATSRKEKDLEHYYKDISNMFECFSKHIIDNGYLIFTLKLGTSKYFTTFTRFINYARKYGFEFVSNLSIDNVDPSIRKQAAFLSTMSTQIIVVFQKMPIHLHYWYINETNIEKYIIKHTYDILKHTPTTVDLSTMVSKISNIISKEFYVILNSSELSKISTIIQSNFYLDAFTNVTLDPNELYVGIEDQNNLFTKLYDLIPILIRKYLTEYGCFTLDDIYYEIALILCEDSKLFDSFFKNTEYRNNIVRLIENYCEVSNNHYIERKLINDQNEDSIDISCMDGYEFEKLIKSLLTAEGYKDVVRIGGAGDRGVDLIARDVQNPTQKVFFQCKRWMANVDSTPIQRLHSMKIVYGPDISRAVCITTSNYTNEAKLIASQTNVELVNGIDIMKKLEQFFPGKYYHGAIQINKE